LRVQVPFDDGSQPAGQGIGVQWPVVGLSAWPCGQPATHLMVPPLMISPAGHTQVPLPLRDMPLVQDGSGWHDLPRGSQTAPGGQPP
jgi:hypothetical protein